MKKLLVIILAVVLAGGGAAAGIVAIVNNQPEAVVRNAIINTIKDFGERDEIAPLMNMLEKGSLEVNAKVDAEKMGISFLGVETIKAGGKLYFSEDAFMLENLNVSYGDIKLSGDAYVGEDLIYVENEEILGGSWGIVRGEMEKAFKKSDLVDMMELDEETTDLIETFLADYDDGKDKELKKDLEKYVEKYLEVAIKAFEENAEYESENDSVKINGKKIDARVIEVTVDAKTVSAVAEAISGELDEDDKLRDLVDEYLSPYKQMLKDEGVIEKGTKELYDKVVDGLEEFADDIKDSDSKEEIVISVVTPKMSSTLMQLSVMTKEGKDKDVLFTLDIGKEGIKKTDCISLSTDGATIEYKVNENNSKEYSSKINLIYEEDDEEITLCEINVDKKNESFEIVTGEDGEITLGGDFITKGKKTTITLDKISAGEVEIKKGFELTLIISEKDKMPKPSSKVTNIFKLDEEKMSEIAEKAEELIGEGFRAEGAPDIEGMPPEIWTPDNDIPEYTIPNLGFPEDSTYEKPVETWYEEYPEEPGYNEPTYDVPVETWYEEYPEDPENNVHIGVQNPSLVIPDVSISISTGVFTAAKNPGIYPGISVETKVVTVNP